VSRRGDTFAQVPSLPRALYQADAITMQCLQELSEALHARERARIVTTGVTLVARRRIHARIEAAHKAIEEALLMQGE
jgi:hypothetical protein